jgi:hypothetical protein
MGLSLAVSRVKRPNAMLFGNAGTISTNHSALAVLYST